MKRVYCLTILSCLGVGYLSAQSPVADSLDTTVALDVHAGQADRGTDYAILYRKEAERLDSLSKTLKALTDRRGALQLEVGKDGKKLNAKVEKKQRELEAKNKELEVVRQKVRASGLCEHLAERQRLNTIVEALCADTLSLTCDITKTEEKICRSEVEMAELVAIRDSLSWQLISENRLYLEQPFSKMTQKELWSIRDRCLKYVATDSNIANFVANTEEIIGYKRIFDGATTAVNSEFDKAGTARMADELSKIANINETQRAEIEMLINQLGNFEKGLEVFKEFIIRLNKYRKGMPVYSIDNYRTDYLYMTREYNIDERIKTHIRPIPYLNKKFDEYVGIIEENPLAHPDIESEILNQNQ